ncbi:MAG: alanine racemase [Firmicutes bacterium]|nr:alanine racemase [Bacillota bacterium]
MILENSSEWLGPNFVEIYLDAIGNNLKELQKRTTASICPILKGDAYGHGLEIIALYLESQGIRYLGVGDLQEALSLRKVGVKCPILVLCPPFPYQVHSFVRERLTATITDLNIAKLLAREAEKQGKKANVHLKIDSGLGRIGVLPENTISLFKEIVSLKDLVVEGVYTHFASATNNLVFTRTQLDTFLQLKKELERISRDKLIFHCANSAAFIRFSQSHQNMEMARIGTLLFGQSPVKIPRDLKLEQTWKLYSRIVEVKRLPKGSSIGYGRTFITKRDSLIGVIPIGYSDGLGVIPTRENHWQHLKSSLKELMFSSKTVKIDKSLLPIVGKIAMGMCCIDLTNYQLKENVFNLVGNKVELSAKRVLTNPRIPRVYYLNGNIKTIWRNKQAFLPLLKENEVFLQEISARTVKNTVYY